MIKNILTIDLESWFHFDIRFFGKFYPRLNKKLDNNFTANAGERLLKLLKRYRQKATFFILGEIFQWYPSLIRKIKKEGHEIAFHGYNHEKLLSKQVFKEQLVLSADFLAKFKPKGFRAPDIYLKRECFSLLKRYNFSYDSSSYGSLEKTRKIKGVSEVPISSFVFRKSSSALDFPCDLNWKLLLREFPFGSGFFLSLLKDKIAFFIQRFNKQRIPVMLLVHPWQVYNQKDYTSVTAKYNNPLSSSRFRARYFWKNPAAVLYTVNILKEFEKLLSQYKFTTVEDFLGV